MKNFYLKPANIIQPIFTNKFNIFKRKPIVLQDRFTRWRNIAKRINLSKDGLIHLEWIIFYYTFAGSNASLVASHFHISRKCFYKWFNRFNNSKENVKVLENQSTKPKHLRQWQVSLLEESRIINLRKQYIHYGKDKLKIIYHKLYDDNPITAWKIERVIRKHNLYPNQIKQEKLTIKKRILAKHKVRIQKLDKQATLWFLLQLDGITIYYYGLKRYILTAIDNTGKFAYARMYKNKSSISATDFLYRLKYVINVPITNLQTDNGSEFEKYFAKAIKLMDITRYYSRNHTPKDNPEIERFNQTLQYEWLNDGNFTEDCHVFNVRLTEWLVEYNFHRPHASLAYQTPIEYIEYNNTNVLPMWSAGTIPCFSSKFVF